ncbi:MAG TPA: sugar-binding protein [Armatimonadota bacterium]
MLLKRLVHVTPVVAVAALGCLLCGGASAKTITDTLGAVDKESGIKLLNPAATTVVTKAKTAGREGSQFFFDVDDTFASKGSLDAMYLTVVYFDEGTSAIQLLYDSHNPANASPDDDTDADINKDPEGGGGRPLVRFNTGVWVQHTFALTNAYLGGRQENGADFHIDALDGSTVAISKVTITTDAPVELIIPWTNAAPKIDGVLDDSVWTETAGHFDLCSGQQDVIQPTKWKSEKDYCGKFHFAWDNDFLYVAGDVTDDVPRCNAHDQAVDLWKGDAFEIYMGWDQSKPTRGSYITGSDYQFIISMGPTPHWAIFSMGGPISFIPEDNGFVAADYVTIKDKVAPDSGYTFEAKVPWKMFPDASGTARKAPAPNQLFGFNVFADDGDGDGTGDATTCGQEKAFSFTSRPSSWGNPSAWATVQMQPPAPVTPAVAYGDVNGDSKFNIADVVAGLRAVAGLATLTGSQKAAMDVNKDGKQNIADVVLMLQKVAGLITKFPAES